MKRPQIKQLKNRLTVMTVPTDSPSTTVMVLVNTGSYFENKSNHGISHFLEHMCFKGTKKLLGKQIMRYLDGLGAETNAFTSNELTGYYVKSITKHWKKTLSVVSDIFLHSTFPEEELEKEKGVIIGEIGMYEDMPMRHVHDIFNELVYGDQPAGRTVLGTRESINNMKREDFVNYHKEHYVASATTIIVAGNVQHKDVVQQVEKNFFNIDVNIKNKKAKIKNSQPGIHVRIQSKDTDQTHIAFGYRSAGFYHKDSTVLKLIASILGGGMSSRLFERLREDMGVGYYVHAANVSHTDAGVLQVSCGVDSSRVLEVLRVLVHDLERLKIELVPEDELRRIKEYIIGNTQMALESTDERAYYYGQRHLFGQEIMSPNQFIKKIRSISSQDIRRVAKKYIKSERLNVAMIGPHDNKNIAKFKRALKTKTP